VIEALLGFAAIFGLALLRVPLAFSMGLVGVVGIAPVSYTHLRAHETG
jgi:C4-dicarboxylate transporter DctM subunit